MLTPTEKAAVRASIASFCVQAEISRLRWTYVEQRPFHGFGVAPSADHIADCSAYVSLAFNWAMHRTRIYLDDPLGERYSGLGNTASEYEFVKGHEAPAQHYLVGDLAIFGTAWNTIHTSICRLAGSASTCVFSSNGHGSTIFFRDAPEPVTLSAAAARQPLLGVFRHPQLL